MLAANPLYKPDDGREDKDEDKPLEGLVKPVVLPKKDQSNLALKEQSIFAEARKRKRKLRETRRKDDTKKERNLLAQYKTDPIGFSQSRKAIT
ncbi:hypothetical protein BsWGS_26271 [Bradybaena similaris]